MYRNDRVLPIYSLILALALFLIAYLDGQHLAARAGHELDHLSSGQYGLVAFGISFLLFAVIGFVVVWLEGKELRPTYKQATPSRGAFVAVLVTSFFLVAASGIFVQAIQYSQRTQVNNTAIEGLLFGIVALLVATVLALYKRYFQDEHVKTEALESEDS